VVNDRRFRPLTCYPWGSTLAVVSRIANLKHEAASSQGPLGKNAGARVPLLYTAGLLALSVAMLSLAFAPIYQFYLAWVGLVPFFLAVRNLRSQRAAFLWGWGAGIAFFVVNMWWLEYVTLAGTAALAVYLALFWAIAAMVIRGCRLLGRWDREAGRAVPPLRPLRCALLVAALWCGLEWVRGNYSPFGAHGLPWLYLGYTQTPFLAACQIADVTGVYGVSFWVVLINAVLAMVWIDRANLKRLRPALLTTCGLMVAAIGYGVFRLNQHTTRPGPTVLVVQCNYPQSNTGEKGASFEAIESFHVQTSAAALAKCEQRAQKVDLVVWSETMMPPFNQQTRTYWRGLNYDYGDMEKTSQNISDLADRYRTSFLVGSTYQADWQWATDDQGHPDPKANDRRNSAYLFGPTGVMSDQRYDKIQLLPFGEFIPYRDSIPWLYRMLISLGPPDMKDYELTAGASDALTAFTLEHVNQANPASSEPVVETQAWRFVVPICFEDIVSPLVDDLLWDKDGKRADFIVNITNDGWFHGSERAQHLQDATFRSIEHRVPTARSVNTGISGFIDSAGRVSDCIAAETAGWSVKQLQVDDRTTVYTRIGDAFGELCAAVTGGIIGYGAWLFLQKRWLER
jgi:apolipoprotein N-acyltransferase